MKFVNFPLWTIKRETLRFPCIRCTHTHNEFLPMKKVNITSYAPVHFRNEMISKIETLVSACGGYVDDFNFFSDLAVNLRILGLKQPDTLKQFFHRLKSDITGLRLDQETVKVLESCTCSTDRYNLFILFHVLFIDARGELKHAVPAFNS